MKYYVRIKKRVRYLRTYTILKRVGERQNVVTKILVKLLQKKQKEGIPV